MVYDYIFLYSGQIRTGRHLWDVTAADTIGIAKVSLWPCRSTCLQVYGSLLVIVQLGYFAGLLPYDLIGKMCSSSPIIAYFRTSEERSYLLGHPSAYLGKPSFLHERLLHDDLRMCSSRKDLES